MTSPDRLDPVSEASPSLCSVLVVDDDPDCLAEYVELISGLGYVCRGLGDAAAALRAIAQDPVIGIVVVDMQLPGIDGLTLLDELSARFTADRVIVPLVITGHASLDNAVSAMRANALDFLAKPVGLEEISAALRRASQRWTRLALQTQLGALVQQAKAHGLSAAATGQTRRQAEATDAELQAEVRTIMRSRRKRGEFLDPGLFSDPAWDILLDLTSAALEAKPVPASSVCAASHAPLSTALRHVQHLVDAGLVRRWQDPVDKRRSLLELEPEAFAAMQAYLRSIWRRQTAS